MLDSVIPIKDAEPRVLALRGRCRAEVKLSDIAQGSWNVEFDGIAWFPRAPVPTILLARTDLERDCGRLSLGRVDAYPPARLLRLGVRRRSTYAPERSEKSYCDY